MERYEKGKFTGGTKGSPAVRKKHTMITPPTPEFWRHNPYCDLCFLVRYKVCHIPNVDPSKLEKKVYRELS